ncbi:MAG: amidohydrolase family protein [Spirochaetaceae bacterium]|jgi:N-acyl-D-aspartate/D-glutamate deacylase|nr:amidohydrolase family protein [Spirochaetaceae bacterium]
MIDLAIRNGCIVDGQGGTPYPGDVGVDKGKIVRIGRNIPERASKELDASNKYVTPGFIDVHRHEDAAVFGPDFGELQVRQGITATINGNCGLSVVPFPRGRRSEIARYLKPIIGNLPPDTEFDACSEYLSLLETRKPAVNFGTHIGNGAIRRAVKGFEPGKLSKEEIHAAHAYLEDAVNSGAFGVSMGLAYIPENLLDIQDCIEILEPIRGTGLPLVTHIRGEGTSLAESLAEVVGLAETLKLPLHISHFKCIGQKNWGRLLKKAEETLNRARERGIRITLDVYPWTAGSTQLVYILPPEFLEGGLAKTTERLKDPTLRRECADILKSPQTRFDNFIELIGWENIMVSSVQTDKNRDCIGKRITEIAAERNCDPFDAAFDLLADENGDVAMVDFIADEQDIETIMRYPESLIVSDSIYPASGKPHPRQYGTYTKLLAEYVRDRKILPLETAIRKITGAPAETFSIPNKGLIKEGYDADITVFDLAKIENHADYLDPCQFGIGFTAVAVNGVMVNDNDKFLGGSSGTVLRRR